MNRCFVLVNRALPDCRFLAVPSFQFPDAGEDFLARVREEVGRYQRPIFYAGSPAAGGTAILVGHTDSVRLQEFPRQAGYLAAGEEGVIVADVDLGSVPGRRGFSEQPRYGHGSGAAGGARLASIPRATKPWRTTPASSMNSPLCWVMSRRS